MVGDGRRLLVSRVDVVSDTGDYLRIGAILQGLCGLSPIVDLRMNRGIRSTSTSRESVRV